MKFAASVCSILFFSLTNPLFGFHPEPNTADSITAQLLFNKGLELQQSAHFDSAIAYFDSATILFTQWKQTGKAVQSLNRKAASLQSKGSYDKALQSLTISPEIETALIQDDPSTAAQRRIMIGSVLRNLGRYDSALAVANSLEAILKRWNEPDRFLRWDIFTLFANIYFSLGELDSSLAYNTHALALFPAPVGDEEMKVSGTYNSIAGIYEAQGNYAKALDYYTRSLELRRRILGEKHPDISHLLNNVATIHFRSGDYDLSLEYYFQSLGIMAETLPSDHPAFGIRYNNIAMSYRGKGEFDKALDYGLRSRTNFIQKLGEKHPNVAGAVNNLGRTYYDMKQYDKALASYQEARSIWEGKLGQKHPNVTQSCFNIGEAYARKKMYPDALEWLERSLSVRRETLGEFNVKVAQSYYAFGRVYAEMKEEDSALFYFHKAILSLVDGMPDSTLYSHPQNLKSASDPDLLAALCGKASALFERGKKNRNTNDLRVSLETYEQAVRLTETIRRGYGSEGAKLQLSQMSLNVFEQGMNTALALYQKTNDDMYVSTAFAFAEKGKAGILQDAISEANAKQFSGIPDSLLEREESLRIQTTYYETLLQKEKEKGNKRDKKKIEQWQTILFQLRRDTEQLTVQFERNYPRYFELKHRLDPVSLSEVRKQLPDKNSALLEFFVGDSTVTIFAVTKKRTIVQSVHNPMLGKHVFELRRSIQNLDNKNYISFAEKLYTQLIAPVKAGLKGITKLYIVPDGVLHHLPFETLLTEFASKTTPANIAALPYLIKRYEVSYLTSASFLIEDGRSSPTPSAHNGEGYEFAGFAPVFADKPQHSRGVLASTRDRITRSRMIDGDLFVELKESETEVRNIYRLFEASGKTAGLFLHDKAQESSLSTAEIGSSRYIHIATHGVINEERPGLSGIIFALPHKGSPQDGILYSGEIYNLKLEADLVVLSACETGIGPIAKGEGILGFTRGFLYAGAKNLMVSLWQVADRSTAVLMTEFYGNILKKRPYASALRHAKLSLIESGTYAHPVEWSPFVLTGK